LPADGARLPVAARSDEELEAGLDALEDGGDPDVAGFAGDVAAPTVAEELLAAAVQALGGVDVLVDNTGGGVIRPTPEHTGDTLRATIDNQLWTTLRCCLAVLPHMVARGGGRIVSIGAGSVRDGLTDHAVHNAAKGGVHALATGLAREFAAPASPSTPWPRPTRAPRSRPRRSTPVRSRRRWAWCSTTRSA